MDREIKRIRKQKSPPRYEQLARALFSKGYIDYLNTGKFDTVLLDEVILNYTKFYTKVCTRYSKEESLYRIGLCKYYAGDHKTAQLWFGKHMKVADTTLPDRYTELWITKSLIKCGRADSANLVLNNYCGKYQFNKDSVKRLVDQDIKNGH